MRKCIRCNAEMVEGMELLIPDSGIGALSKGLMGAVRRDIVVKAKAAVCPQCGEVSFYLEDVGALRESTRYLIL